MSNLPVKMGNIEPYPFQRNLITEIIDYVRPAVKRQQVLPPAFLEAYVSAGKTIVIGGVVNYVSQFNLKLLVLARTAELVSQNNEEIWNMDSQSCMLCGSLGFRQFSQNVIVASEKTASGALHSGKRSNFEDSNWVPHIILIDECHQVNWRDALDEKTTEYSKILDHFKRKNPYVAIVGLTGTPYRGTESIKGDFWGAKIGESIDRDFLVKNEYIHPTIFGFGETEYKIEGFTPEEEGIQEYSTRDLNKMHESMDMGTTEKIMKEVQGIMQNRLCALLTCAGVKHCEECASFLSNDEYAIITDKTGVKDRKAILDGAKNGELNERGTYRYKYILQIGCLTTGVNVPPWDTSVLLRRIGSLTLLNQLLGRGMRLLKPKHIEMGMHKENHLCLDYSGTMESMHQLFNDPMLEDAIMEKDKSERRMIACPNCGGEVGERCSICPHCQHLLQFELCEDIHRGIGLAEYVFKKGCGHKNTKGTRVCKKCGGYMKDPEANLRADSYDANDWFEVDGMTLEAFGNGGSNIKVTYLLKNGSKAEKNYFGLTGKGKHIFKGDFINTHINCRQWQGKIAGMMNSGNIQGIVKMQKMFGCPAFITHRINDKGQSVVHGKQFLDKRTFMGGKTVDPTK